MRPKIFIVGYNKCGTTSLHNFLEQQGVLAAHYWAGKDSQSGERIALALAVRQHPPLAPFLSGALQWREWAGLVRDFAPTADARMRRFLDRWEAYSGIFYMDERRLMEPSDCVQTLLRLYPDAYFILNDRDVESWLRSRAKHHGGDLMRRAKTFYGVTDEDDVKLRWRMLHSRGISAIRSTLAGNPRFLYFKIDADPISHVIDLLAPHYDLKPEHWGVHNKTPVEA